MYCDQCGQQNKDDAKFCTRCGADMAAETSQTTKSIEARASATKAQDKSQKSKKTLVWTILSWVLGVTFLLAGFGFFFTENAILLDFVAGVLLILLAVLVIPPLKIIPDKLLKRKLSAPFRWLAVISLVFVVAYVIGEAERQKGDALEESRIAAFNKNKEQVLNQVSKLISEGNFEGALSFSSDYAFTNDKELLALRVQARKSLAEVQKTRAAKLENERLAAEEVKERGEQLAQKKAQDAAERAAVVLPGFWTCSNQSSFRFRRDGTFLYAVNGYAYQKLPKNEKDRFAMTEGTYRFEDSVLRLDEKTVYFFWPDELVESAHLKQNWDISDSPQGTYGVFRYTLLDDDRLEMYTLEHSMPSLQAESMVYPETERKEFRECKKLGDENYEDPLKATEDTIDVEDVRAVNAAPEAVSTDHSVIMMPLVEPDMKLYRWIGVLEKMDRTENNYTFVVRLGSPEYRFFAVASEIADVDTSSLRIGGQIVVTGRYFSNFEYKTVLGVTKTGPLLAAQSVSAR